MQKVNEKPGSEKSVRSWLAPAACTAFAAATAYYALSVLLAGGNPAGLFCYAAVLVLCVLLPGYFLADLLVPAARLGEKWVIAMPLGAVVLLLSFTVLGWFLPWVFWGLPSLVLCGGFFYRKKIPAFNRKSLARRQDLWLLLLVFSAGLALYACIGVMISAKVSRAGNMDYNQDLLWSMGNAASAAFGMPVRDIRVAGGLLHYHYFADILNGLLALFSWQSSWDAVGFFSWPFWFGLLGLGMYYVSRRFGAGRIPALLITVGALFCHYRWDASFQHLFVNANGVLQSYVFLLAALLVLQMAQRDGFFDKKALVCFGLCMLALLWSKSTVGILVLCALWAAGLVWGLVHKKINTWLFAAAVISLFFAGALYILLYSGAINNLVFQPTMHAVKDAFRILLQGYLPGFLLYLCALFFALRHFTKLDVPALVVHALVAGGILAYMLFSHYSFSQSYFLLTASFLMWLCVAQAAPWFTAPQTLTKILCAFCVWGLVMTGFTNWHTAKRGLQTTVRTLGLRPPYGIQAQTVTRDDDAAARWLAQNMTKEDVFATNRNAKDPAAAEGVFHYYTAASQRQAYVESWRYGMDYSLEYHQLRHNLEQVSESIFRCEDFASAQEIAAANGIDFLLVHLPYGGHAFSGKTADFVSDTVLIYRI